MRIILTLHVRDATPVKVGEGIVRDLERAVNDWIVGPLGKPADPDDHISAVTDYTVEFQLD
jgi:hypothetical protein